MNEPYPLGIYRYLRSVSRVTNDFTYLKLDTHHCVIESGGDLNRYGLGNLNATVPIDEQFDPLTGLLPVDDRNVALLHINYSEKRYIDIYIVNDKDNEWVLLVDSTIEGRRAQSKQQQRLNDDLSSECRI